MTISITRTLTTFTAGIAVAAASAFTFQAMSVDAIDDDEATFVPTSPCRLFDFRPDPDNVGPRTSPLGPNETAQVQVTGAHGNCNVPAGATAISMNVTALNATAPSFLQLWPQNEMQPDGGSSLNYVPGQTPTPNKVDVKLSPAGAISMYNLAGSVDVIGDVVGYYSPDGLQDLEARLIALETRPRPFSVDSGPPEATVLGSLGLAFSTPITSLSVAAPADGRVVVTVAGEVTEIENNEQLQCRIIASNGEPQSPPVSWQSPSGGDNTSFATQAAFDVDADSTTLFTVLCAHSSVLEDAGSVELHTVATYWPTVDVPTEGG